jgi:type 1 glutamine amidotransferase
MPAGGKEALLKFLEDGKGFVGFHCASDTFHSGDKVDPYIRMLGGEFAGHGGQQKSRLLAASKTFPIKELKDVDFPEEEWYEFRNFNPDMHVILIQDTQSMSEDAYKKQPNYPETWARKQGKGRVFYTSMGHREDVWTNPVFQNVVLGGDAGGDGAGV